MLSRFLPARLRVKIDTARADVRSLKRAFTEPRTKGARARELAAAKPGTETARPARVSSPVAEQVENVVVFADSGVELVVPPGQSILDAGLAAGVDLLFSCTVGGCGACMLQVLEGEVVYDEPETICLLDDEIERGACLACVGRPRGKVVLEA